MCSVWGRGCVVATFAGLPRIVQRGAEVDVERRPADDQRGYRLDSRRLGIGDAVLLFAQMHHFDLMPGGIERDRELLLGGYADRASRVLEDGLVHWRLLG